MQQRMVGANIIPHEQRGPRITDLKPTTWIRLPMVAV